MVLTKIYQGNFGKVGVSNTSPPAESVILGDVPSVTQDGRYRVPLIGLSGVLPDQVVLLCPPAGRFSPDTPLDVVYDAGARGEFSFSSVKPRQGMFAVESLSLLDGSYDSWVVAVS